MYRKLCNMQEVGYTEIVRCIVCKADRLHRLQMSRSSDCTASAPLGMKHTTVCATPPPIWPSGRPRVPALDDGGVVGDDVRPQVEAAAAFDHAPRARRVERSRRDGISRSADCIASAPLGMEQTTVSRYPSRGVPFANGSYQMFLHLWHCNPPITIM